MALDEEKDQKGYNYVPGFGSLADFIYSDNDHSTVVYRRFDKLAARDLLYYQSELGRLQALQDGFDIQDAKDIEDFQKPDDWLDIRSHATDWAKFKEAADISSSVASSSSPNVSTVEGRWKKRMELAMEIRRTLKDYREALIQESTLPSLRHPSHQTMTALSSYFHTKINGDTGTPQQTTYPMLTGTSSHLYPLRMSSSQIEESDYISLSQNLGSDLLTHFLKTYCSRLFRARRLAPVLPYDRGPTISHPPRHQVTHYSLQRVRLVVSFITTLTAALLLFLPIYTLYHTSESRPALTLGLVALFTLLFAGAMVLMTKARPAEIFGACAAYAAVLVVFVSGDFAGGGGNGAWRIKAAPD